MSDDISRFFEDGRHVDLAAGEPLFHTGDRVNSVYLVLRGRIELTRQTSTGMGVTQQVAGPGDVLAEASVYSRTYHCDARARVDSTLRAIPVAAFRARLAHDRDAAESWAVYLAGAVRLARTRAEIRTLRTVAERLDAWLAENGALPGKGGWSDLATELGVSREALYRELAQRRPEPRR